jgi:tctex1 domain-containing protein 2
MSVNKQEISFKNTTTTRRRRINRNPNDNNSDSHRNEVTKHSNSRKSSSDLSGLNPNTMTNLNNRVIRIENTYRLSPDESKRFYAYKIKPLITQLMISKIEECEKILVKGYDHSLFAIFIKDLADSIRRNVKNLTTPRYKILVHLTIGQNLNQDVRVGSRCLWDTNLDSSLTISHTSKVVWVSSVVFVIYTE